MKIVVAVRCYNEERHIERFLKGYSFVDKIIVSDGGSTDNSLSILKNRENVDVVHFPVFEEANGRRWNPDNPHIQFVLDETKKYDPSWVILDDMDCVPNLYLRDYAREMFDMALRRNYLQINAFRLYLWNDDQYFPYMNRHFDPAYTSLWAWRPKELDIHADINVHHGTLVGLHSEPYRLEIPMCLLHKSWDEETIQEKIDNYKTFGIAFGHPFEFAGKPEKLPEWAKE